MEHPDTPSLEEREASMGMSSVRPPLGDDGGPGVPDVGQGPPRGSRVPPSSTTVLGVPGDSPSVVPPLRMAPAGEGRVRFGGQHDLQAEHGRTGSSLPPFASFGRPPSTPGAMDPFEPLGVYTTPASSGVDRDIPLSPSPSPELSAMREDMRAMAEGISRLSMTVDSLTRPAVLAEHRRRPLSPSDPGDVGM